MTDTSGMAANWRQRLKEIGKDAYIREEMERLGFWPPNEEVARQAEAALAQLKIRSSEVAVLRAELRLVDAELALSKDIPGLIAEIRKRRIERVRAAHAQRKQEREQEQAARRLQRQEWRRTTLPYLGHGVSAGLRYEGGEPAKVAELGLPALATATDVASALQIDERQLAWLTYHRGAATVDHYHRFTIPKRSGGARSISAPKRQLRAAQQWLLTAVLNPVPVHEAAMAFRPRRSIVDNAALHTGQGLVLRLDLKDFFPSIELPRVKGAFRNLGYNEGVATILALLATEAPRVAATLDGQRRYVSVGQRRLPQGACTSPALTNILCRRMDARLTGIARTYGFTYSRYADDLVFSHPRSDAAAGNLFTSVRRIVAAEGFQVNEEKTVVMRPQHRQAVTGLVVNEKPRVSRADMRKFRAFLHHCEQHGVLEMSKRLGKNAEAYAAGYLAFLHMVDPAQEEKVRAAHPWLAHK